MIRYIEGFFNVYNIPVNRNMTIQNEWLSTFLSSADIIESMKTLKLRKTIVSNQKTHKTKAIVKQWFSI